MPCSPATQQRLLRHRGPDGSGVQVMTNADGSCSSLAHERIAIMDPLSGNQPLFSKNRDLSIAVNGEIYNYKELRELVNDESRFRTNSDCEPIVHMYEKVGDKVAEYLDGDFAFVILNERTGELYAADTRDEGLRTSSLKSAPTVRTDLIAFHFGEGMLGPMPDMTRHD